MDRLTSRADLSDLEKYGNGQNSSEILVKLSKCTVLALM